MSRPPESAALLAWLHAEHRKTKAKCPECARFTIFKSESLLFNGGYKVIERCPGCEVDITTIHEATWVARTAARIRRERGTL